MKEHRLFWLRILRASALIVLVTGLLPALSVLPSLQEPWRLFFGLLSWPIDGIPSGLSPSERQLSAVIGGVLCGWAWLLYQLARPETFNPSIRRMMLHSTWIWFVLDSAGSFLAGLPLNAGSNLFFLVILLLPLSKLRSAENMADKPRT